MGDLNFLPGDAPMFKKRFEIAYSHAARALRIN
jgi:hypothetical protein